MFMQGPASIISLRKANEGQEILLIINFFLYDFVNNKFYKIKDNKFKTLKDILFKRNSTYFYT